MLLSIVTPTRGNFSDYWIEQLTAVQGDVEFVLVYPPGQPIRELSDPRIKIIVCPFKAELIQRSIGLMNAMGEYVLALDDDDFLHPQVTDLIKSYFDLYPDSLCLRLKKKNISYKDTELIKRDWDKLPDLSSLIVADERVERGKYTRDKILQKLPIAPLENPFKMTALLPYGKRTDQNGYHPENYNNMVWKNHITKTALEDLLRFTKSLGPFAYIPFWSLDRLLSLYIQAQYFEKGGFIGHWLRDVEQVRYIQMMPIQKGEVRYEHGGDLILALRFPQYGYFWNLFAYGMWFTIKAFVRNSYGSIRRVFSGK